MEVLQAALGDRYDLGEEVGRGGMCAVYEAYDRRHERRVAVKVLESVGETRLIGRFRAEIYLVAGLVHPNILPLHDSGEGEGAVYFVMPFVVERTLGEKINGGIPGRDEALQIVSDIASALDFAHAQGVVHCDIKPGNVFVFADRAVVADFGIARLVSGGARDEDSKSKVGTAPYMAPEQITQAPMDPRTDVYALAAVAYETLTGQRAFPGDRVGDVLADKIHGEWVPAPATDLETAAMKVIRKGLARVPADRFESAGEFARALARALRPSYDRRLASMALTLGAVTAVLGALSALEWFEARELAPDRVVVAPFANFTSDARLDPVSGMTAFWITEGLSRTGVVDVVPTFTAVRSTHFVEESAAADPATALARETRAGIVVVGSFGRTADSLSFQAEVMDARSGELIGSISPVRTGLDPSIGVEAVRSRVMGLLATRLDPRVLDVEVQAPPNYEAYQAFSAGLDAYVRNDFSGAIPLFESAYLADSTMVSALLYAAINDTNLRRWDVAENRVAYVQDRRHRLSPYDQHWLDYRVAFHANEPDRALASIREAARLAPGSKAAYNWGVEAMENGRLEEAVAAFQTLDVNRGPMRDFVWHAAAIPVSLHLLGRHRSARSAAREATDYFPEALITIAWEMISDVGMGRSGRALERLRSIHDRGADAFGISPGSVMLELAEELRAHGYRSEAEEAAGMAIDYVETGVGADGSLDARYLRASALYELGRWRDSYTEAERLAGEAPGSYAYVGLLGRSAARLGLSGVALESVETLYGLGEPHLKGEHLRQVAFVHLAGGNPGLGVEVLLEAKQEGVRYGAWLHRHIDLVGLEANPEFLALATPVIR